MTWIYNIHKKTKSAGGYIILLIFMLAMFSSCEDVLDKSPTDRFSDDQVWKDANLITAFVYNTYQLMPTGNTYGAQKLGTSGTDEIYGRGGSQTFINKGEITSSSLGNLNYWTGGTRFNYWTVITKCNIFFDNMPTSPIDEAVKNRLTGEMKLLRA